MAKITKTSAKGIELIKSFEGLVLKPYRCSAGVPTIGYGNTFYENGKKVALTKFEQYVDSYCIDTITQDQFDALVSFCYNLGPGNLKASTLLKKVNKDPNDPTIRAEFMKWNKAGGRALKGLTRRREAEANLYFA